MFVCCKYAKPITSYEPVKRRISDEDVFQRRNTQAAACFRCLPQVQYMNKCYNHLDDVTWPAELSWLLCRFSTFLRSVLLQTYC